MTAARRGDLIVYERKHRDSYQGGGVHEHVTYALGLVRSITRDGSVRRIRTGYGSETDVIRIAGWTGRVWIVARESLRDPGGCVAFVGPQTFTSVDGAAAAVRPWKVTRA
jgi:hypothetical protein